MCCEECILNQKCSLRGQKKAHLSHKMIFKRGAIRVNCRTVLQWNTTIPCTQTQNRETIFNNVGKCFWHIFKKQIKNNTHNMRVKKNYTHTYTLVGIAVLLYFFSNKLFRNTCISVIYFGNCSLYIDLSHLFLIF